MLKRIIICLLICLCVFPMARTALAADPIEMTITYDPATELSDTGKVAWIKFTLHNKTEMSYTLTNPSLESAAFPVPRLVENITIAANSVRDIIVNNADIKGDWLGKPLAFTLKWSEGTPAVSRSTSANVTIERFVEPVMVVGSTATRSAVKVGGTYEIKYSLSNPTKFDMTGLALRDPNVSTGNITLTKTSLQAGETMTITYTGTMEESNISSRPVATYTVRNKSTETQAAAITLVESVAVALRFDVQPYPPTEEGTTFALIVTNTGTQSMTDIRVYDDINTLVLEKFDLAAGEAKSFSYTITPPSVSEQMRKVSFRAAATDYFGIPYAYQDENTYDAVPYIESDQVNLSLIVVLTRLHYDESGVLMGLFDFEIRNYSQVSIRDAKVLETQVFTDAPVTDITALSAGVTAFQREYKLDGVQSLSFVLTGSDITGQTYSIAPTVIDIAQRTLDMGPLATPAPEGETGRGSLLGRLGATLLTIVYVTLGIIVLAGFVALLLYKAEGDTTRLLPARKVQTEPLFSSAASTADFEQTPPATIEQQPLPPTFPGAQNGAENSVDYVAPAKLRYLDTQQSEPDTKTTAVAPIPVLREGWEEIGMPREIPKQRQALRRPLVWNEYKRVKTGRSGG